MSELEDLLRFTHRLATREGAIDEAGADEVEAAFEPSEQLSASERVGVYARMVRNRFFGVMRDEFVGVRRHLGDAPFAAAVRAYLADRPSTHFSLSRLGARFPAWLAERHGEASFVVELATLERARQDVFDAPVDALITSEDLEAIGAAERLTARFAIVRAHRRFTFSHDVHGALRELRDGNDVAAPAPSRTHLLIHRHGWRLHRRTMAREPFLLLSSFADGATLEEAFTSLAAFPDVDLDAVAAGVAGWFRDWTAAGIFRAPLK